MRIPLAGQYRRSEIRKAIALQMWPSLPLLVLAALFLACLVLLAAMSDDPSRAFAIVAKLGLAYAVGMVAFCFVAAELQWRGGKGYRSPVEGEVTEEALHLRHAHGHTTIPWADLYRYKAARGMVLLYNSPFNSVPIARRLFDSEEAWVRFRSHVQASVPGPARGWWVGGALFLFFFLLIALSLFNVY